jgi:hypothetical protein
MICKLCQEDRNHLIKAHIIPEFLYTQSGLYNEQDKFIDTDTTKLKNGQKSFKPKGDYDENILCQECDNIIIGQTEDYANKIFFGKFSKANCINENVKDLNEIIQYAEVDYQKFKLFLISLLWKASITTREFFRNINIGIQNEESLRKMIFDKDPRVYNVYPAIIATSVFDEEYLLNTIIEPYQWASSEDNILTCRFFIGSFVFLYKVCKVENDNLEKIVITEDNNLKILKLYNGETRKIIESEIGIVGF